MTPDLTREAIDRRVAAQAATDIAIAAMNNGLWAELKVSGHWDDDNARLRWRVWFRHCLAMIQEKQEPCYWWEFPRDAEV